MFTILVFLVLVLSWLFSMYEWCMHMSVKISAPMHTEAEHDIFSLTPTLRQDLSLIWKLTSLPKLNDQWVCGFACICP